MRRTRFPRFRIAMVAVVVLGGGVAGPGEASAGPCPIRVGAGAEESARSQIVDAFRRNGGPSRVGCPTGKVSRWGAGSIQRFSGGGGGRGGIMLADGKETAFWVHGAIWRTYRRDHGGGPGWLGYPVTDDVDVVSAVSGSTARRQAFRTPGRAGRAVLVHWRSGAHRGATFTVEGEMLTTWRLGDPGRRAKRDPRRIVKGFERSLLGLPTSNEIVRRGGARLEFEGGVLRWTDGEYADAVFRAADRFGLPTRGIWSPWAWHLSQGCGEYYAPYGGYHLGADVNWGDGAQDVGRKIFASGAGKVRYRGEVRGVGHALIVESAVPVRGTDRIAYVTIVYRLLGPQDLTQSWYVRRGDVIGRIGAVSENGGLTPHLHWAVKKYPYNGSPTIPGYTLDPGVMRSFMQPLTFVAGPNGPSHERYNQSPDCTPPGWSTGTTPPTEPVVWPDSSDRAGEPCLSWLGDPPRCVDPQPSRHDTR